MPGKNCSIYGCTNSQGKCPNMSFFKVPAGKDECVQKWADSLIKEIWKARFIDPSLKKQIESKTLFICDIRLMKQVFFSDERN